jgi:hypothetical protein
VTSYIDKKKETRNLYRREEELLGETFIWKAEKNGRIMLIRESFEEGR